MDKDEDKDIKEKILSAAYSIFTNRGKSGTRMQEIADTAGVNKALIHYYFRSKDNLYVTVVKQVIERFILTIFLDLDFSPGFKEVLRGFIFRHIKTIKENSQAFQFVFSEVWTNQAEVMAIFQQSLTIGNKSVYTLFHERIRKAIEQKEIREIEPFHLLVNILSLDIFFFVISPTYFLISQLNPEEQELAVKRREEEVFNFVWESIRLRNEE